MLKQCLLKRKRRNTYNLFAISRCGRGGPCSHNKRRGRGGGGGRGKVGNLCKPCGVIQQRSCWTTSERRRSSTNRRSVPEYHSGPSIPTTHINHTFQQLSFSLRNRFRFSPPCLSESDPSDGFGSPRANRRSAAWSLRCTAETQEEEKNKKDEKKRRKSDATEVDSLPSPGF